MNLASLFSKVHTLEADGAKAWMAERRPADYVLLDVRQPEEYEAGHLPGARLIPIPELEGRLDELPRDHAILVY